MLEKESPPRSDLFNIWRVNPSFRQFNQKRVLHRAIPIIIVLPVLTLLYYVIFNNLFFSVGVLILVTSGLLFEQLVNECKKVSTMFHEIIRVDPFENLKISKLTEDSASILVINKKTATNVIIRVFQVEVLPENVQPTLNQYIKALNNSKLGYSYQVVQKPMITLLKNDKKDEERLKYFTIFIGRI